MQQRSHNVCRTRLLCEHLFRVFILKVILYFRNHIFREKCIVSYWSLQNLNYSEFNLIFKEYVV